MLSLILLIIALVVLLFAATGAVLPKVNLLCLGLALWLAAQIAARLGA